jgi:hypothetical protein
LKNPGCRQHAPFSRSARLQSCGLVTFYVFFVIELATRRIDIAGITPSPGEPWMHRLIEPDALPGSTINAIKCAQRLGGMLRFYHRTAA